MKQTGRKLTPAVRRKLIQSLEAGASLNEGCAYIGMTTRAVRNARKSDRAFSRDISRARERGKVKLIMLVRRGAQKNAKLALDMLSRMYPEQWSERRKLEHSGPNNGPVQMQVVEELVDVDA